MKMNFPGRRSVHFLLFEFHARNQESIFILLLHETEENKYVPERYSLYNKWTINLL